MEALAVIPARGGSKGLPRKNVRLLCGKPLVAWTIEAALAAKTISRVIVSTDDEEIAAVSRQYGAEVVRRPRAISGDTSPSEAALVHVLETLGVTEGRLAFLQCTSPLTLPEDIDRTVEALDDADSAFTAAPWHHFLWQEGPDGAIPLGHEKSYRPMRQELRGPYLEVGAVYAVRIDAFLTNPGRFVGRTVMVPIPHERSLEIDTEEELLFAELLLRRRLQQGKAALLPAKVEALVVDFDGVLTDDRVLLREDGVEAVHCHRGDGWALRRLREAGIRLLVLTFERNPVVRRRCEKLGVECIVAEGSKLPFLQAWLEREGIEPRAALYVGNDTSDIPCLVHVGCGIAPSDAHPAAKRAARMILETPGGGGCIRELATMLLPEEDVSWNALV